MNGVIGDFFPNREFIVYEYLRCDLRKKSPVNSVSWVSVIGFKCFKSEYIPWLTHHLL